MLKSAVSVAAAVILSGCATIMGSPTQTLPITSAPSGATIVIVDEGGREVFSGTTPTSVTLNKSNGNYWGGKSFTITISKPGFKEQNVPVISGANGWYIAGNLLFGGLIGWFVIDPLNGNMYTLSSDSVFATLASDNVQTNRMVEDNISIVMLQDVPSNLRERLVLIN